MKLSCEQIHFLGVCTQIPSEQFVSEPVKLWEKFYMDGTMDRLLTASGASKVYGLLFCNPGKNEDTYSYYIACENRKGEPSEEFENIDVEPGHYMAFEQKGADPQQRMGYYASLYEEAYKEWLPNAKYEALVDPFEHTYTDGRAVIESIVPKELESVNYEMSLWLPIKRPAGYQSHNNKSLREMIKNFKK